MKDLSPREVLALVAAAMPSECREGVVVVGSLAAGYHLLGKRHDAQVRTKDVDCLLLPRVAALRTGRAVAETLLRAGWRPRMEGSHSRPGDAGTPEDALPAVRLHPPHSAGWFLELLAEHAAEDEADRRWMRLRIKGGHFGLPSYRYLDVASHDAPVTESGLRCARPEMMALSNLLRNPVIRPERMEALVEGRRVRRSLKDLGRVVAIARLSDPDAPTRWPRAWVAALRARHPSRWRDLASGAGSGLVALLENATDVEEACLTGNAGLLASEPLTPDQFRRTARRLLQDAIEPLAMVGRGEEG
jgi:hypothetical protein